MEPFVDLDDAENSVLIRTAPKDDPCPRAPDLFCQL